VLVSKGYPLKFKTGYEILINNNPLVFFSGASLVNKKVITNGGRVMSVVGMGRRVQDAYNQAYDHIKDISFTDMFYRKDIGK
jgi:phosphoribosylamine-glycine ligase